MVTSTKTKTSKADRQQKLKLVPSKSHPDKVDAPAPVKAVEPTKLPTPAPKVDTPKTDTPKKKRKWSAHHLAWKATKDFPETARIVVLSAENPKKRTAAHKFAIYKRGPEGMTVGEYIEASHKTGTPKAVAKEDIKWDYTGGFISVDGVKAPSNK